MRVRDDDDRFQAERVAYNRDADAGVASGTFDHRTAGFDQALGERVPDDEERGAVLYRLTGIHELGLAENLAAGAGSEGPLRRISGVLPMAARTSALMSGEDMEILDEAGGEGPGRT